MDSKSILDQILELALSWFTKKEAVVQITLPLESEPKTEEMKGAPVENIPSSIDWSNKDMQVTDHFTVGDCLTLHSWNRLATDSDGLTDETKSNMIFLCQKMEQVRNALGCPINVHCIYRSPDYNTQVVKAIAHDVHSLGEAIDFDCNGHFTINELHQKLEPMLEGLNLRMERNTLTWIHLDTHPVKNARYFNA